MSSVEANVKRRAVNYKYRKNNNVNFRDVLRQVSNAIFHVSLFFVGVFKSCILNFQKYKSMIKNKRESLLERVRNVTYDMRENEITSFIDKTCIK